MDPGYDGTGDPVTASNDLVLSAQVSVNLLTGQRDVSATGLIRPFRLHLLGDALDLATIHFCGARFQAAPGSDVKFTADIAGTEIGTMLSFLQAIEDFISPSGGNGFYHTIDPLPLQIEVGYRFSQDFFTVGALIFQNIGFSVGAILPLDGRQAEFHFSLATRDKPFLISAPPPTPYGGGGFIGLRANASGVIGFEIQLEFGAIFAVQFGPLYATARITAGIYLLSSAGGYHVLEGFVQAVGEGNIACFSVSILIQIKTTQQSDSSMSGSSTYEFTFKVSVVEVSYSVTAGYQVKGSGGGGGGGAGTSGQAPLVDGAIRTDALTHSSSQALPLLRQIKKKVRTTGYAMQENWKEYRKYFEI
jgi:hypothetical protein